MDTIGNPWLWGGFFLVVIVALLADLVLMRHGGPHKVTFREALYWSIGWVLLALAFNAGLWWYMVETAGPVIGNRVGLEFLTGYLVEKALAVDNIFVFLMIFGYFAVPEVQRQRGEARGPPSVFTRTHEDGPDIVCGRFRAPDGSSLAGVRSISSHGTAAPSQGRTRASYAGTAAAWRTSNSGRGFFSVTA